MRTWSRKLRAWEKLIIACVAAGVLLVWWRLPSGEAQLLWNTMQLGLTALAISLPIASLLAFALSRCVVPGKHFWEGCLLALLFLPLYIQLASWEAGFGRGGWYSLLIAEQLSNPPLDGFRGAAWVHAMAAVPWLFWILRMGLQQIPRTYEDAASLDATPFQTFRHVVLPLTIPSFVGGGLYAMVIAATEITATDRYQFRSYAEVLYYEFVLNTRFDELPLGIAPIAVNMIGVILTGMVLCRLLWPTFIHATGSETVEPKGPVSWMALGIVGSLVGMLFFLPVANLLYQAGIEVTQVGEQRQRIWSLTKLFTICARSPLVYSRELAWTALTSQLSAGAALITAVGMGWLAMRSRAWQYAGMVLSVICFVTPGPFISFGLMWLLNREHPQFVGDLYAETVLAPWLALTIRCFPFAYLIVLVGLKSIPQSILDAASTDGADSLSTLSHVALPIIRPSLFSAIIVSLAVCVGELSASILVLPPGVDTVASRIFHLIHYGAEDELAGICLSCLIMMVMLSALARRAFYRLGAGLS